MSFSFYHAFFFLLFFTSLPPLHPPFLPYLSHILLLFGLEGEFNEHLLQLLITVVDNELLKTVCLCTSGREKVKGQVGVVIQSRDLNNAL